MQMTALSPASVLSRAPAGPDCHSRWMKPDTGSPRAAVVWHGKKQPSTIAMPIGSGVACARKFDMSTIALLVGHGIGYA